MEEAQSNAGANSRKNMAKNESSRRENFSKREYDHFCEGFAGDSTSHL
jgi:hypothetical protein